MPYETVTAFFDDSGGPDPNSSRAFCFGAVVVARLPGPGVLRRMG